MGKHAILYTIGGGSYVLLELAWRGRSHWSMFALGGACFLAIGIPGRHLKRRRLLLRSLIGSATITAGELLCGLALNQDYAIWDYRALPLNFRGQICLPFSLIWIPVSTVAAVLFEGCDKALER